MKRIKKLVLVTGAALALAMSLSGCYYFDVEMTANDRNSLDNAMVKIYFATDYTNGTPDINVDGHGYAHWASISRSTVCSGRCLCLG